MGQFGKTCFEFKAPFVRLENFYATIEYNAQVAAVLRSLEVLTDQIAGLQCLEADPGQVWLLEQLVHRSEQAFNDLLQAACEEGNELNRIAFDQHVKSLAIVKGAQDRVKALCNVTFFHAAC